MDYRQYFKGKKVTVMGLGLLGRGIGDTVFLAECGAEIIVTDLKSKEALEESLTQLSQFKNISYTFGEHREEDFKGRDLILKAAGVPLDSKYIEIAKNDNAEIAMSGALFAKLSGVPIIGVTGTRGKSTTTHLIHHVLTQVKGEDSALLGGNVRGVSNLQLLKNIKKDSVVVMELDSWQLQGFGEYKISPHIAILTNLMEDHMNYYHGSMEKYFSDKANIFRYQKKSGIFITTKDTFILVEEFMKKNNEELQSQVKLIDSSILPSDCPITMPGEHNRLNAAFALETLRSLGLSDKEIFAGFATFPGLPGRLEYLGEIGGVRIYNDNNATTPDATVAALRAVGNHTKKNVVLIVGGDDKKLDMSALVKEIPLWCSKVILFKERGTDRIREEILAMQKDGLVVYEEEGLEATVKRAVEVAVPGEVLLYSPAFSSFGKYFKNEFDRGDQFNNLVKKM